MELHNHSTNQALISRAVLTQFIDADESMDQAIDKYVNNDLPRLAQIPKELRDALASTVYLIRAEIAQQADAQPQIPFFFSIGELDLEPVKKYLKKSIKCCPLNRRAHQKLLDVLKRQLDNRHIDKRKKESLRKQVIKAKEEIVHVFSDEVESALTLIDHYFEEDEIDKAKAIFAKLSDQRFEDPRNALSQVSDAARQNRAERLGTLFDGSDEIGNEAERTIDAKSYSEDRTQEPIARVDSPEQPVSKSASLIAKAESLRDELSKDDTEDLNRILELLERAEQDNDHLMVEELQTELDDILFYLAD